MHSNRKFIPALLWLATVAAVISMGLFQAEAAPRKIRPITKKNWYNHPEIKKVRAVYAEVMALAKQKKLKARKLEVDMGNCPGLGEEREIYLDSGKMVRRYKVLGDYETLKTLNDFFYDRKQRLRFVLIVIHSYENQMKGVKSPDEVRIYFDQAGNVLVGITKGVETKGKRIIHIGSWETRYQMKLVFKPLAAFSKKEEC